MDMKGSLMPKIEFFSIIPEVAKIAPIVPANIYRPEWLTRATKEYLNMKKQPSFGLDKIRHTSICPGIYNLVRHGWIMTTWQDIVINTNGDGETFTWSSALDQTKLNAGVGETVSWHTKEQFAGYMDSWDNSLSCILKIQTPWRCIVPKDYYLLESAVPYSDDHRFTTMPGFFSQEHGISTLNVQIKWHVKNDKVVIKAGTPIAHYMLVPKEKFEMQSRPATDEELKLDTISLLELNRRNVSNQSQSKCLFAELFKK